MSMASAVIKVKQKDIERLRESRESNSKRNSELSERYRRLRYPQNNIHTSSLYEPPIDVVVNRKKVLRPLSESCQIHLPGTKVEKSTGKVRKKRLF